MESGAKSWVQRTTARATEAVAGEASAPLGPATFIDDGAEFEGTLRLTGTFRIDAEFRGEIVSDGTVIVGEAAGVQANLRAREVVVAGAVVGDVEASRLVVIRATGRLHGSVQTPCLEVEKGALFNGTTSMAHPETARRTAAKKGSAAKAEVPKPTATASPS